MSSFAAFLASPAVPDGRYTWDDLCLVYASRVRHALSEPLSDLASVARVALWQTWSEAGAPETFPAGHVVIRRALADLVRTRVRRERLAEALPPAPSSVDEEEWADYRLLVAALRARLDEAGRILLDLLLEEGDWPERLRTVARVMGVREDRMGRRIIAEATGLSEWEVRRQIERLRATARQVLREE